jgi:allantoin racemase
LHNEGIEMRILVVVPVVVDDEGVSRRAAQIPEELLGEVDVIYRAVKRGPVRFDSETDSLLAEFFCYEAGITAEADGFDAVCVDTTSDSGVAALKSRLSIPVVGPGESSYHLAQLLGKKFSIITLSKEWQHTNLSDVSKAGFADSCASVRYVDVEPDLDELLTGQEEELFPALVRVAEKCVADDGADVIILGSTTMHEAHAHLSEHLNVPVINPGVASLWMAYILARAGLAQSKHAYPAPGTPQDAAFRAAADAASSVALD